MSYAVRITRTAKELMPFFERLTAASVRLIAYEHTDGARAHVHMYVDGASVGTDTMKNWVKKALGVTAFPKTDWVFATPKPDQTPDTFITYMSKGRYDPVIAKGFEPSQVNTLKGNWLDYATQMRSHGPKKPVAPQLKWADMLDIAEARLRKEQLHTDSVSRVIDCAISVAKQVVYVENKALVGRHKFRDFVDTLVARVSDNEKWQWTQTLFMQYK